AGLSVWSGCTRSPPSGDAPAGPASPRRIVSLTLATDEMLAELVPIERMAGVTQLADDPDISNIAGRYPASIPRLRDADPERVIALGPDLVCVAPYNTADALKLLERAGLSIYRNEALHSLDEIEAGVRKLGGRVGAAEAAERLVERMQTRRRALAQSLANLARRPRVLFWSGGYTAGKRTTIDDVIREAGAVNVATELGLEGNVEIAPERVVAADPEIILEPRWAAYQGQGQIASHPILRQLQAVRKGRVLSIEGRYLSSLSQFAVEGVERLARRLHPECFPQEGR
ncbi:MAG TPA: ABC transporter substrate-binding protein, partial [Gemmataceae bacterium]|nr:ABC transporter substrate-binding protein [Gemmataceae bacterium]